MAISSAPRRGGHPVHHDQLTIIAAFVAGLIVAAIGVALLVRDGGPASSGVRGSGIGGPSGNSFPPVRCDAELANGYAAGARAPLA